MSCGDEPGLDGRRQRHDDAFALVQRVLLRRGTPVHDDVARSMSRAANARLAHHAEVGDEPVESRVPASSARHDVLADLGLAHDARPVARSPAGAGPARRRRSPGSPRPASCDGCPKSSHSTRIADADDDARVGHVEHGEHLEIDEVRDGARLTRSIRLPTAPPTARPSAMTTQACGGPVAPPHPRRRRPAPERRRR